MREEHRPRHARGEIGSHLAVDPFPERTRHSSRFITQLIAQQVSTDEDEPDTEDGIAAFDATAVGAG